MKNSRKMCWSAVVTALLTLFQIQAQAQSTELQQLLLNIEKLTQLKAILADMKTGYQIYQQGYGTISSLSKGNFSLHQVYLTGLLAVNPAVRNNPRVREIISQQSSLLAEYRRYQVLFKRSGTFSASEINYIRTVYHQLVRQSNVHVDDLAGITTAGKFRMSDDDRLRAIDRIYSGSTDQLQFLRWFNRKAVMLSLQRVKDRQDTEALKQLYGIH